MKQSGAINRNHPHSADRRRGNTRERAIDAAERLLVSGGYSQMSVDAVARELGIRPPSLYHHFPGGREALLLAVAARRTTADQIQLAAIFEAQSDPIARLRAAANHFATLAGHNTRHALAESRRHLPPEARQQLQAEYAAAIERPLVSVIEQAMEEGTFRVSPPLAAVRVFLMLMLNLGEFEGDLSLRRALPDFVLGLFLDGMRIRPGDESVPPHPRRAGRRPATREKSGARKPGD